MFLCPFVGIALRFFPKNMQQPVPRVGECAGDTLKKSTLKDKNI